ncbi:MAG: glycosyltransferase [Bifidobacterium tibiigranuli]|jgi:glycosyltransferase involved in cell wall biosynthesis|nr:glycosyltransferase [Bifidobacterium tibiigranuli]
MPVLSIVIPAYNNTRYLPECIRSITAQEVADLEIIVVDDASTDNTYATVEGLVKEDSRIAALRHAVNQGTLAARTTGVAASTGDYVMLIDQDDALAPGALRQLLATTQAHPADIYHFGVRVEAANPAAQQAAAGMTGFLTPAPREIEGADILRTQFAETGGFDWHIHHKMFRGEVIRRACAAAERTRLLLSDDLYMSFIVDSMAERYYAIESSPWYIYHLGRGDTFGSALTIEGLDAIADRDAKGLALVRSYAAGPQAPRREDWAERIADVRDRLIEHVMNEWKDNLPFDLQSQGLDVVLRSWEADAVCGELFRYVRDAAYAYLQAADRSSGNPSAQTAAVRQEALRYLDMAARLERTFDPAQSANRRYHAMRDIACRHAHDAGLDAAAAPEPQQTQQSQQSQEHRGLHNLRAWLKRRLRNG